MLVIEILPVALPAAVGENLAVNVVVCPAVSVCGVVRPLILKPVPDALPCDIATLAVPEFVRVTLTDPLAPTKRAPKLMLVGFAVSAPCTPVPLSATETVGLLAALVITTLPVAFPLAVGAKFAVKLVLWFAASVKGVESPVTLKPVPLELTAEMVALALPVLVNVTVCCPLLPTATFPNATLPGLAVRLEFVLTPVPTMLRT